MVRRWLHILCWVILTGSATAVAAQDVQLVSKKGAIVLEGPLLGFDGEHFRIDTVYGPLTVSAAGVICKGAECPNPGSYVPNIRISGDSHLVQNLLPPLIEGFANDAGFVVTSGPFTSGRATYRLRGDGLTAHFDLHATTTAEGYADLITEGSEIALVTRPPSAAEIGMSRSSGSGDLLAGRRARVLALDAIVIVGPDGDKKQTLTMRDLRQRLDQSDPEGSSQLNFLEGQLGIEETLRSFLPSAGSDNASLKAEDTEPLSATLESTAKPEQLVELTGRCRAFGSPTEFAINTGDYPLALPVLLYTAPKRLPKIARDFLAFLDTSDAAKITRQAGYRVPEILQAEFDHMGTRLAQAISRVSSTAALEDLQRFSNALGGKRRLSATFRFLDGTTELDMASRDLIRRFSRLVEQGTYADESFILAGFSESGAGSFRTSARLIAKVQTALEKEGITDLRLEPMGNVMPVICDDTELGRRLNRRVEIWLE